VRLRALLFLHRNRLASTHLKEPARKAVVHD
jgi:hypothetical protein